MSEAEADSLTLASAPHQPLLTQVRLPEADAPWSLPLRLLFRFIGSYFVIYSFPYPLSLIPGTGKAVAFYANHWNDGVAWVGAHVLHLAQPIAELSNGSGDRLFAWVEQGCFLAVALSATVLWSILNRRRASYRKLHGWLRILLRYQLASALLYYGFSKVIKNQFSFPEENRLNERVGDMSPMGLLWTFMGYSTVYTFFGGAMEALGGLLLLFRRTTTLGALVTVGVMGNIVLMNFSYDVPVKIYSSILLAMAIALLAPDLGRLADVLVRNRPVAAASLAPPYAARLPVLGGYALKTLLIGYLLYTNVQSNLAVHKQFATAPGDASFDGAWKVEEFVRDGAPVPPLATDATRWSLLIVSFSRSVGVRAMDDSIQRYGFEDDAAAHQWVLTPRGPGSDPNAPPEKLKLPYSRTDKDHLILEGPFGGARLKISLTRLDPSRFLLVNRGFHWINEFPFNR